MELTDQQKANLPHAIASIPISVLTAEIERARGETSVDPRVEKVIADTVADEIDKRLITG